MNEQNSQPYVKLPNGYELHLSSSEPVTLKGAEVLGQLQLIDADLKQQRLKAGDATEPVMRDLFQHAVKVAAEAIAAGGGVGATEERKADDVPGEVPPRTRTQTFKERFDLTSKFVDVATKVASWFS